MPGGEDETATEGDGETDAETEGAAETDPDTDTDTDTGGPDALHPDCAAADPDVRAAFEISFEDWPDIDPDQGGEYVSYSADDDCMVSSLEIAEDTWSTGLDCSDGTDTKTATLHIASAAGESPAWAEGDAVHLTAQGSVDGFGGSEFVELTGNGTMLARAIDGEDVESTLEVLAGRVDATGSYDECNAPVPPSDDASPGTLALHFEEDGESVVIVGGHRGRFDHDDGSSTVIDVERAESGLCCHAFHGIKVLQRRTVP